MVENKCSEMICCVPFNKFQITTGISTPCCSGWCKNYEIGNLFDDGIDAVWNSNAMKEFSILNGSYKFCDMKRCFPKWVKRNTLCDCIEENRLYETKTKASHNTL